MLIPDLKHQLGLTKDPHRHDVLPSCAKHPKLVRHFDSDQVGNIAARPQEIIFLTLVPPKPGFPVRSLASGTSEAARSDRRVLGFSPSRRIPVRRSVSLKFPCGN